MLIHFINLSPVARRPTSTTNSIFPQGTAPKKLEMLWDKSRPRSNDYMLNDNQLDDIEWYYQNPSESEGYP